MSVPYGQPFDVTGKQGTGDASVLFIAKQMLWITQFKGKPDQGRDRGKGDISFIEIKRDTEDIFSFYFFLVFIYSIISGD